MNAEHPFVVDMQRWAGGNLFVALPGLTTIEFSGDKLTFHFGALWISMPFNAASNAQQAFQVAATYARENQHTIRGLDYRQVREAAQ